MNSEKSQTLLCVDDDQQNLELLNALLSSQKFALKFSRSGEDALVQIAKEVPDLILLDVMMPGMSGYDLLERLRSEERTRTIPVILVTALNTAEDKAKGSEMGCDDFISKPFDKIELVARIRSLLRISLYRKSLDEKEKLWKVIQELSPPMILCSPDWVITNLNRAAQRYLMPGTDFEKVNFLDFIFDHYSVSVSRNALTDPGTAPKKFQIEKKGSERFAIGRAEVKLGVLKNSLQEVESIALMLREIAGDAETKGQNKGFSWPWPGSKKSDKNDQE